MTANELHARHIVQTLRDHGFVAYFAGGCVRDRLLSLEPKDFDVATNARAEVVQRGEPFRTAGDTEVVLRLLAELDPGLLPRLDGMFGFGLVLFTKIGGLVTDAGGVASHSAVVAREFGLPAVVGTSIATERIATGDRVRVNGTTGTVELFGPAAT